MSKFNIAEMNQRTYWKKDDYNQIIRRALDVAHDPLKSERLGMKQCVVCFYSNGMEGQAFTYKNCESCGVKCEYSTTDTNDLCGECAIKFGACAKCGCSIDLKQKRENKNEPTK